MENMENGGEYIRLTSQQSIDIVIAILQEIAQPISEPINASSIQMIFNFD